MTTTTSYDDVLYPSYTHSQTHPDRLATLATLNGLQPAAAPNSRILELACGQGGNLIPLAVSYPNSRCVGIDLSQRQIELGQAVIDALDLKNIELRTQSILDFPADASQFDYIVAHGVYSWVPEPVRDKILQICRDHLSPQGVAIVSYNTFPGWHQRRMIRDMMLFHTKRFTEPAKRIEQAKAFLTFMTQATGTESAYGRSLHEEFRMLSVSDESYLFHEQLEEVNEPVYFHQFADQIAKHDLQYLCEVEQSNLQFERYPPQIAEVLSKMEIIEREQYLDFFTKRTFRQTLMCHREVTLNRDDIASRISGLRLAMAGPLVAPDQQTTDQPLVLKSSQGAELTIREPLAKTAFRQLANQAPNWVPFEELQISVRKEVGRGSLVVQSQDDFQRDTRVLAETLTHAFIFGAIELHASEPAFILDVTDRPRACPLARHQAASGDRVTNRLHTSIVLDPISRWLLTKLDGSCDLQQLLDQMVAFVINEKIAMQIDGRVLTNVGEIREHMKEKLKPALQQFARQALLVA
jgi:methyltransferase-like protein/2-polyprenyl-3-methyl-5-hydroxy-6-metoxy-1,4-benzoquinol methylase